MKSNYAKCLSVVLAFEGGYSNHPKDPGKATMKGITQATYDVYRKRIGKPTQSVRKINDAELQAIYREQFWDAIKGDDLPVGVDLAIFDFAVNSGVARAVRSVQKVLNTSGLVSGDAIVKQDGQIGMATELAINKAYESDEVKFIELYCADRYEFVQKLSTFSTFGKGWTRRIEGNRLGTQDNDVGVVDIAVMMAKEDVPQSAVNKAIKELDVPESQQNGKASTEDVKIQATPEGAASGTAAVGTAGAAAAKAGVGGFISDQIVNLGQLAGFTKEQIEPYIGFSTYLTYAFLALGILGVIGVVAVRIKKQREGSVEA